MLQLTGHAVSMINADQYRSMADQNSVIDQNIDFHGSTLIFIDRHWCQCHKFDPSLIGIDRH